MRCRFRLALLVFGWPMTAAMAQDRAAEEFFETTIRPLLVEQCLNCHGEEKPKGGLKLTSREAILVGGHGGPAAEPGKAEESLLLEVVRYDSEPRLMRGLRCGIAAPGVGEGSHARRDR